MRLSRSFPLLFASLCLLLASTAGTAARAATPEAPKAAEGMSNEKDKLTEKKSVTRHAITLGNRKIEYTATAGTLILRDDEAKPKASMFYVSYIADGFPDPARRPVTFCFNGGPGAASLWVHLGAFGPRKVQRDSEGMALAPPAILIDNDQSILDHSDLVFIDPISTGYSRAATGEDPKQFHGLKEDIQWVSEFIRLWLVRNERFASPKFVAGESYGTTRAAGIALHLLDRYGIELNGVALLSLILNWQDQEFGIGNDLPYIIHIPTYTATAWFHKKLPPELSGDLRAALAESEKFALGEYATALLEGNRLAPARRREIAAKLARLTGLSPEYIERTNLRVELERFQKELLRSEGRTVGRLDSRFVGRDLDNAGEYSEFDPATPPLVGPYAAATNDYLRRELKFQDDAVYEHLTRKVRPWGWDGFENRYANLGETLRQAMTKNPHMKVLIASGLYDFATPYFDAIYSVSHLGLPLELEPNVVIETYEAGHMMYIKDTEHQKLKADLATFYRQAIPKR